MVQAGRQAKSMSGWSINNKKHWFLHSSVELCRWGKEVWTASTQEEPQEKLHSFCRKPPPQSSTIHQWLLQSYWAFTRHLHISDKRNKKHFKATLPTVPTLFHLSNAYKTAVEVQMCLGGTPLASLNPSKDITAIFYFLDYKSLRATSFKKMCQEMKWNEKTIPVYESHWTTDHFFWKILQNLRPRTDILS